MLNVNEFLIRHPVFTRKRFEAFVREKGSKRKNTLKQILHYHQKQGRIINVKRNLYAAVPPGRNPEQYPVDSFLLAGHMNEDAVIGYHTALELHGHAHSVQHRYLYLTEKATHPFSFRGMKFKPVSFPKALIVKKQQRMEVESMNREGCHIDVTTLERTLVDALDRPHLSGGWEEIWRSFTGIGYLKIERLIEYVCALDNQTTTAKTGFFLEQNRETFSVREEDLKRLEDGVPDQPRYMDKDLGSGTMQTRWNLIVPDYILTQGWHE